MGSPVGTARADESQDRRDGTTVAAALPWPRRVLETVTVGFALFGGFVLVGFMAISVGSIVSRAFFGSPLLGDFEITERGSAIAVFTVLPYCHLKGGHVVVDMFVGMVPQALRRWLALASEAAFAVVAGVLTWRLAIGGYELHIYNDQSMMLQIPTWWVFVPVVASMALLTLVCLARSATALSRDAS
ncbi:MAG: TRAP transporter small permease [Rhodospirillales bacterium]|nr:TRAP transporter small permease [Rhodospirillales bacterium]